MNIFILDYTHTLNAQYHTDKHVVKMLLESTQLLCNAVENAPYRKTHLKHPCSLWVLQSLDNWLWLRDLVEALHIEWQHRFNHTKHHKSYAVAMNLTVPQLSQNGLTPFAQAMPDMYKNVDAVKTYRDYHIGDKQHLFKLTKRNIPEWILSELSL